MPIPNIEDLQATVGHDDAQVTATINLDHGPKVSTCQVQWGEVIPGQPISYSHSVPCEPPAPYEDEVTQISTHIAGLATETDYQARVIVKTNNGTNRSVGVKFRPRGRPLRRDRAGHRRHADHGRAARIARS